MKYSFIKLFNLARVSPIAFKKMYRDEVVRPIRIIFCTVDHFEPGTGGVGLHEERRRMNALLDVYPKIADGHRDSRGNIPKRTWFFPPHYHRNENLKMLVSLCDGGYGEIELHLHHGKVHPDTPENLEEVLSETIQEYSRFGIFGQENGRRKYGFIHGNNALDNSRKGRFCGVNGEIEILKRTGCYADFTFPCFNEANPYQINSFFYAKDDPNRPKSHNRGVKVGRNRKPSGDLMIIQGPLYPYMVDGRITGLRIHGPSIADEGHGSITGRRIDCWVKTGIHVEGCPHWIFVKTDLHGCMHEDAINGKQTSKIFQCLESQYNDGIKYTLHYVTARELYNIVKAIECGEPLVDPEDYRDYAIKRPLYDASVGISSASDHLRKLIEKTYA